MGGHQGGETASRIAVETVVSRVGAGFQHPDWQADQLIEEAIVGANGAVFEKSLTSPTLKGMGTTLTALLFQMGTVSIGHVGDSRCYLVRNGSIWQLTRDHSLVQEKLRAGLIARKDLKTDQMKNVITRSVGYDFEVSVELYTLQTQATDTYLLCSDGLSGLIEDPEALETIVEFGIKQQDWSAASGALVAQANAAGGDDNITAVLVHLL